MPLSSEETDRKRVASDTERPGIEAIIDARYPELSQGQKKVAAQIRRDLPGVAFLSAARIGQLAGVSEATVHRLALALDFAGFSDMQEHMKVGFMDDRTVARLRSSTGTIRGGSFGPGLALETDLDNLKRTLGFNQDLQVWEAGRLLQRASRIYVAGWRASIAVSSFLAYSLNFMLGNALLIAEGEWLERVVHMGREDVLLTVAFPRYSSANLKLTEMAHRQGTSVVVLTDTPISPFVPEARVSLYAATASDGFLDSYTAPLALGNALVQVVSHLGKDTVLANLEKLENGFKEARQIYRNPWKQV